MVENKSLIFGEASDSPLHVNNCEYRDSCWECWRYLGDDEDHICVKCIAKAKHDQVK